MHKYRYLIYCNIIFLAALVTLGLRRHQSNVPIPTEAEQMQMRYEDSIKFDDIKREADYVFPDDCMLPDPQPQIYHLNKL